MTESGMQQMSTASGEQSWPAVTFLIPTLNSASTIGRCLESIFSLNYPMERIKVWVLDGYSEDGTAEVASKFDVTIHRIHGNPSVAYNSVLGHIETPLVALVDSDAHVHREWLKTLVSSLLADNAQAAGSRILSWESDSIWSEAIGVELDSRYSHLPTNPERIATTCMVVKTHDLREIGGFDVGLDTGYDVALGYELQRRGKKIRFRPEALVYHLHRTSPRTYAIQQFRYGRDAVKLAIRWPRVIRGDSVTPAWMTIQPILLSIGLIGTALWVLSPRTFVLAGVSGFAALASIGILWVGMAVRAIIQSRSPKIFPFAIVIQTLRAWAWTLGVTMGLIDHLLSVVRSSRDAPVEDGDKV